MDSTYKVVLKNAEPPTIEGREQLKANMIVSLGLDELRASEIVDAMPITLREGLSDAEAQNFAGVLRELGSLVFVEDDDANSFINNSTPTETKAWYLQPLNIVLIGILASCAMLASSIFLKQSAPATEMSPRALKKMLRAQNKILTASKEVQTLSDGILQESWLGEFKDRDVTIDLALLTANGKPLKALVKLESEFPGERTAEEIIRGVYKPWLRSGEGSLIIFNEKKGAFGPEISPDHKETLLLGAVRMYAEVGGLGSRLVTSASVTMTKVISPDEREFSIAIRYLPKEKFIKDSFMLDYSKTDGYSFVLNKKVVLKKRKDKEGFFDDPFALRATEDSQEEVTETNKEQAEPIKSNEE